MTRGSNEPPNGGVGITVRVVLAVVVIVMALGAVLWILELVTPAVFEVLLTRTALIGGVVILVALALGWLGGGRR